jgi:hypothetical protein
VNWKPVQGHSVGDVYGSLRVHSDVIAERVRAGQREAVFCVSGLKVEALQRAACITARCRSSQRTQIVRAAQRVLDTSSAKTPKIEREPAAPGWTNTVLSAVRGLTRTIPPSPMRPTKSSPPEVDVMLSGKAFVPGTGIDSTFWVAASTVKLSTKARKANVGKHGTRLDTVTFPMRLPIEEDIGCSDLVAFKQHEIAERISSRQSKSPQSVPA